MIGGGDTVAAVRRAGIEAKIGYISTAGGAFLEFLEGRTLPGVDALTDSGRSMMRAPLVIGNWKMHGTLAEARALATGIRDGLKLDVRSGTGGVPALHGSGRRGRRSSADSPVGLGAQNCHYDAAGAHTGEISPTMLLELGVRARSCSAIRSAGTSWARRMS